MWTRTFREVLMSYARKGSPDSDIYLYHHIEGDYLCDACKLHGKHTTMFMENIYQVAEHLAEHIDAGHNVPQHTIDRIIKEIREGLST